MQAATHLQEIWSKYLLTFIQVKLLWGGMFVATSVQITNMGGGFKKGVWVPRILAVVSGMGQLKE